jgi:site-specific recombinase XerD
MLANLALDEFLTVRSTRLNEKSVEQYQWELSRFVAFLDEHHVHDTNQLSAAVVANYVNSLREHTTARGQPLSSRSVLHYSKGVRCFLSWLVAEELAPARCLRWELPKAEKKIPATLDADAIKRLLRACQESHGPALQARDTAIVLLLLDVGLRASELCGLKTNQVLLEGDPHILIKGEAKGGRWREVGPLSQRTLRALRSYLRTWRPRQHPTCENLFVNRMGEAMQVIVLERLLERLKRRAGVDARVNPHSWRHTWARGRAMEGTDALVISRLMGHSALSTTQLYLGQFGSADARKRVETAMVDTL